MDPESARCILLVEDEFLLALNEKSQLERHGYKVITAPSGEGAIETLRGNSEIGLILMDINLGKGMDGTEAAEIILKDRGIPIVFLSSHMEPEIVARTQKITSYGYVVKNSSTTVLDASIKMAFKLHAAQQEIRHKNERLSFAQEASHAGTWDWDIVQGSFVWSAEFLRVFGMPEGTIAGFESWSQAVHPDDRAIAAGRIQEAVDRKTDLFSEYRIAWPDGGIRWIQATGRTFYDGDRPLRMLGLCMDITARKLAEERLARSERNLAEAQSVAKVGSWEWDMVSNDVSWSREMYRIYGLTPENHDIRPEALLKVVHPEDVAEFTQSMNRNLEDGGSPELEYRVIHGDGSVHHIHASGKTELGEHGRPLRSLGTAQDITELKKTEEALRESEERYRRLITNLEIGIVAHAPDTSIRMSNHKAAELLGLSEAQMWGKTAIDPYWRFIEPEGGTLPLEEYPVKQVLRNRVPLVDQILGVCQSGSGDIVWLDVNGFPVFDKDGSLSEILISFSDITGRKNAEERIRDYVAEKENLVREINHRVRNSMTVIESLLALQMQKLREPDAVEVLKDINGKIRSMRLLYDLLYQTGNFKEAKIGTYLEHLVKEAVNIFPGSDKVRTEFRVVDFFLGVKEMSVVGLMCNEIATNAMKHAFKGRDGGRIEVAASKTGRHIRLSIGDDGAGMPVGISVGTSNGFGMTLLAGLAGELGGSIRIERGQGTTFVLEFEADDP